VNILLFWVFLRELFVFFVELGALSFFYRGLKTGTPSYFNRFLLILLIANYAFLIWIFYLKGWQYFK
jgi:hypothetical protein